MDELNKPKNQIYAVRVSHALFYNVSWFLFVDIKIGAKKYKLFILDVKKCKLPFKSCTRIKSS